MNANRAASEVAAVGLLWAHVGMGRGVDGSAGALGSLHRRRRQGLVWRSSYESLCTCSPQLARGDVRPACDLWISVAGRHRRLTAYSCGAIGCMNEPMRERGQMKQPVGDCFCAQCQGGSESVCERIFGKRPVVAPTKKPAATRKNVASASRPLGFAFYASQRDAGLSHDEAVTSTQQHMSVKHVAYVAAAKLLAKAWAAR